jgi:hypothetical protein
MVYPAEAVAATLLVPRLLGSFERELHDSINEVVNRVWSNIINIGCADGYYAIGLARRLPTAHVYAVDSDPSFRSLCSKMAELNGVRGRVSVTDAVGTDELNGLLPENSPPSFVLCDCEGCELDLLDPQVAPRLRTAWLLVELHDFVNPTIGQTLLDRFEGTHEITRIPSSERDCHQYEELAALSDDDAALALTESRLRPVSKLSRRHRSCELAAIQVCRSGLPKQALVQPLNVLNEACE